MKAPLFLAALLLAATPGAQASDAPAITGMRVHLFESDTGTWSKEDALAPSSKSLWNTVAGPKASHAALVVVELAGPPGGAFNGYFGPKTRYTVRLVAAEQGRAARLLDLSQVVPVLSSDGKAYLPFMLYQGGCARVRLTATLRGPKPGAPVEKSLAFACGE